MPWSFMFPSEPAAWLGWDRRRQDYCCGWETQVSGAADLLLKLAMGMEWGWGLRGGKAASSQNLWQGQTFTLPPASFSHQHRTLPRFCSLTPSLHIHDR